MCILCTFASVSEFQPCLIEAGALVRMWAVTERHMFHFSDWDARVVQGASAIARAGRHVGGAEAENGDPGF